MRIFTPVEIETLIGTTPDRLRDWRRRGFLDGFGVCRLPDGEGWTSDASDPRLSGSERWAYRIEDVVALFAAREIGNLGVILHPAFRLGLKSCDLMISWSRTLDKQQPKPSIRYLLTYPQIETGDAEDPHIPVYAVDGVSTIEFLARPATIIVDCEKMASLLPAELRAIIAE